jgi:hypothetical protein
MNTSWEVTVIPNNGRIAGSVGTLSLIETYPKRCFVFYSNLYFMNAAPQFYAGVNATLRLGYEITAGTTITLHLPGFTNSVGAYTLNVLEEGSTSYDAEVCWTDGLWAVRSAKCWVDWRVVDWVGSLADS